MAIYNRFFFSPFVYVVSNLNVLIWRAGILRHSQETVNGQHATAKNHLRNKNMLKITLFFIVYSPRLICEHLKSMSDVKMCIICKINEADKYLCSVWKEGINRDLSVGWGLSRSHCKSKEAFSTPKSVRRMAQEEETLVCCTRLMTWSSGTCTYLNVNASRI